MTQFFAITYKWARRFAIAVVGTTVVLIGIVMIVLPGPAILVIPAGLAILGIEFAFARRWLQQVKSTGGLVIDKLCFWRKRREGAAAMKTCLTPQRLTRPQGER